MVPHGMFDGLVGLADRIQVSATFPEDFIAFEYPVGRPACWNDIIEGLPNPIVKDGLMVLRPCPKGHGGLGPPRSGRDVQ